VLLTTLSVIEQSDEGDENPGDTEDYYSDIDGERIDESVLWGFISLQCYAIPQMNILQMRSLEI